MQEVVSLSLQTNELTAVTNKRLAMYLNFHENGISLAQRAPESTRTNWQYIEMWNSCIDSALYYSKIYINYVVPH